MNSVKKSIHKFEVVHDPQEFTFNEFQNMLKELRKVGESILEKVNSSSSSKEENYKSCVENFKKRIDLLDKFAQYLSNEMRVLQEDTEYSQDDEKKIEEMEARSKRKNLEAFLLTIEAERKREDFYRRKAIEKYMKHHLEIEKAKTTDK